MKSLTATDEIKSGTPYIGFVDLVGKGNVKLTIAGVDDVSGEKIDGKREAKPYTYALTFKEIPGRKLIIQGRKKKFLIRHFNSKKAADWVGQTVELYADPDVMFGREKVGGIKFVGMSPTQSE